MRTFLISATFVISANYRDRDSDYRWLVRRSAQRPEDAKAFKTVRAKGVIFCPSTDYERGFGCTIVIYAHEVETEGEEPTKIKLRFRGPGYNDFVDETGKVHEQVAELFLGADGTMEAVPMPS